MPTAFSRSLDFLQVHRRWAMVALLYLFSVLSALDRQALSVFAPLLKEHLHFGVVEYSYIVSSFLAAYTLGYAFCGRIIDRYGIKLVLGVALISWSFFGLLHAFALGWMSLAIFRFLLGFGESFNVPAGVKAVTEWTPPRERGLCVALFSNGHVTGAILAPPLIGSLAYYFGWRWGFVLTGALGFVVAALWFRLYQSPAKHPGLRESERTLILSANGVPFPGDRKTNPTFLQLIRHPLCIGFFFAQFLTDPIAFFLNFWLPDYYHSRGMTLGMIALLGWIPFLGSDLGGPGGGAISDWLVRRKWNPVQARRILMLIAACTMLLANFAVQAKALWSSILLISMLFAAQSCWKANLFTFIAESVPRNSLATLVALSAFGGGLGGIISNLIAGRVIETYGYQPVFTTISLLPLAAFGVLELTSRAARRSGKHIRA